MVPDTNFAFDIDIKQVLFFYLLLPIAIPTATGAITGRILSKDLVDHGIVKGLLSSIPTIFLGLIAWAFLVEYESDLHFIEQFIPGSRPLSLWIITMITSITGTVYWVVWPNRNRSKTNQNPPNP